MKYRLSEKMKLLLEKPGYNFDTDMKMIPEKLHDFLRGSIIISNDCILIKELCDIAPGGLDAYEKSIYEYDANKFHPDFFVEGDVSEIDQLKLGLECSKILASRLVAEFGQLRIRVMLSYSETEIVNDEIEVFSSSTLRFYQIRSEDGRMPHSDMSLIKSEAILEIET